MLRDITLGQYYITDSKLHRLDPRVKLAGTMLYIISVFVLNGLLGYFIAFAFFAAMVRISKVPFKFIVKGLKAVIFILILTAACNLIFSKGEHVLVSFGIINISIEGIETAICMAIRLIMLILGTSVMTLTTTPNDLTDGIEKSMGFLEKVKIPVHDIALMMSIALRFIPILVEETNKIMKAQISRGADFESGGIIKRVKNYIPIIVPLFISSFHRASDLAMAMESRCYTSGRERTKLYPLKYKKSDYRAYALLLAYFILVISLKCIFVYNGMNGFWTV